MQIDFSKSPDGLLQAVVQDASTDKVLMVGYLNEAALTQMQAEGMVAFFSRSKQRLWTKEEIVANSLKIKEIKPDCNGETLLIKAYPATGVDTCFNEINEGKATFLNYLQKKIIRNRKENPLEGSYTSQLFKKGVNKIAQKVGEEAVELVIEAKDSNDALFKAEAADLLFHYLILLEHRNVDLDDIVGVLEARHQ